MKILTNWLRSYLPDLPVSDAQLAEDLTLRGIAVEGIYDLGPGNGSLFEMDITTNRVDAMNHYGIAREAATIYGLQLKPIELALPEPRSSGQDFDVRIEAQDACGRFTARVLRGITIGNSRDWFPGAEVATYFELLEQKQISNAVDATNFAWLAMGQPTHAFDLDKIEGGIIVRRARKGEKLKTLDGVERTLDPEDLVVADHAKPLGLAGVMGGWDTMITPTRPTFSSKPHGSSPWPCAAPHAATASTPTPAIASSAAPTSTPALSLPPSSAASCSPTAASSKAISSTCASLRGEARTARRAADQLSPSAKSIAFSARPKTRKASPRPTVEVDSLTPSAANSLRHSSQAHAWQVTLPSWRLDLEREIDLIEEVARVYGYNRFANTLPSFGGGVRALPWAEAETAVRHTLLAAGFHEAIASTFCSAAEAALTAPIPGQVVPLGNPLSEEAGVLRPSLVPGMLATVAGNLHRDVADVHLFELGTVFSGTTERVDERPALAFAAAGALPDQSSLHPSRNIDFYDAKGVVEQILSRFQINAAYFDRFPPEVGLTPAWLHPYRAARVVADGLTVGWFGQLHPSEAAARKLKAPILIGELYVDRLYKLPIRKPVAREISRFQPVRRDFSLILDQSIAWETINQALATLQIPELVDWRAREVFRDGRHSSQEYSLLVSATFQARDRTLREEELQDFQARVVEAVSNAGARLRT